MGKVKAMMMDFEEELHTLVDIESIICECEDFAQFNLKLMIQPGVLAWWVDAGNNTGRNIVQNIWNDYWSCGI